jgi:hypothetical protein
MPTSFFISKRNSKRHDVMVCLYICSFSSASHRSVQFNPALLDAPQLVRLLRTGRVMLVRTFVKFISFLPALFDASANRFRVSRSDTQRQPIIISTGREMCVTVCHSRCVVLFCCCLVFSCLDNFSIDHPLIFPSVQIVMLCIPLPLSCSHLVWRSFKNPQRIKQLDQTLEWILPLLLLIILL